MVRCKICHKTAVLEKGFINIAAFMYPLCSQHMKEYIQFKNEAAKK